MCSSILKFIKNLSIWMVPILLITRTFNLVFYVYPFITQTPTDYYKIRRFFGTSFKNWCLKTYEFREQKYSREKGGRVVKAERIERKVRSIVEGKDRYIDRQRGRICASLYTAFKNIIDDKEWSRKMYTFAIWIAIIKVNIFTGQPISFNKCKINAIA